MLGRISKTELSSILAAFGLAAFPGAAVAETYIGTIGVTGYVTDLFANTDGLMIRIETDKRPTGCINPPNGWMIVPRGYDEMTSAILSHWLSGRRYMTIYAGASQNVYCSINGVGIVD